MGIKAPSLGLALGGLMAWLLLAPALAGSIDNGKLRLRIIHTNDMHSRFEEISQRNAGCSAVDKQLGKCYGGFARVATLIRQIRDNASPDLPTFFLNAGDTYLGSKLFTFYKWKIVAYFLNKLRPDVASLGNHEFDLGPEGLAPFLDNITFPVVAANLDLSGEPSLSNRPQLTKYKILEARGRKLGVVGYLTPDTKHLSQTGRVGFLDEVAAIREQARLLKAQGVEIIVALGHSGFETDKRIGREVEEVDLVIGGHTNTFLYNGPPPDSERPEGPYPFVVEQPRTGRKVYVAQAFAYTKYLGDLTVDFDARGEVSGIHGQPILLDNAVPKARDVELELDKWLDEVNDYSSQQLGHTRVLLQGDEKACRLGECNLANLLVDAMVFHNTNQTSEDNGWTDAPIAIHQAGGIRASIGTINENKVTYDDVVTALPFGSLLYKVQVPGKILMEALEWSVHDRIDQNTTSHGGCFLHYSGLQVVYNISKPLNSRVVSVRARCSECSVPVYEDLNLNVNYSVLMPDFMYKGGDGFSMFKDTIFTNLNASTAEVVSNYIRQMSPVYPGVEGRIKILLSDAPVAESSQPNSSSSADNNVRQLTIFTIISCLWLLLLAAI